jgi:hypothetical protein
VIWLDTPVAVCLERNRQRPRQVPEATIQRMSARFEVPSSSSSTSSWESAVLRLDGTHTDHAAAAALVRRFVRDLHATGRPVVRAAAAAVDDDDHHHHHHGLSMERQQHELFLQRQRAITRQSFRHAADQYLRRAVQAVAQIHTQWAALANAVRRDMLQQLKIVTNADANTAHHWDDTDFLALRECFLRQLLTQASYSWSLLETKSLELKLRDALEKVKVDG